MLQNDASQTGSATDARNDLDVLDQCDLGPATGNVISGVGTVTGTAGADSVADAPATIVAVNGIESSGGTIQVEGTYGTLTIQSDGSYSYTRSPNAPDGVSDIFTYTLADGAGARDNATLTIDLRCQEDEEPEQAQNLNAITTEDGVVMLPAGVELSDIRVVGRDLVITLPDGSTMTVPGGAVFVPQIVIGDVEVPPTNLAALLIDQEPQPASGTPQSSGGNFAEPVPPLDPGVPLGDLIPPTEMTFPEPVFEEVGQFLDEEPEITIQPDGQPASVNAVDAVEEAGLPTRNGGEPAGSGESADGNGSDNDDSSETTTGTIHIDSPDEPSVVTINGVAVTAVGQQIEGEFGTLTIISISGSEIGYSYTLGDNTSGNNTSDFFTVTVTDSDGDSDTATLTIDIVDDVPTARNDADSVREEGPLVADGNVFTGSGGSDANSSDGVADTPGADDAEVDSFSFGGSEGTFGVPLAGAHGSLVLTSNGSYTYTLSNGDPEVQALGEGETLTEVFTYTIVDGDGDTSTATLTITITGTNDAPTIGDAAVVVSEEGLPGGQPDDAGVPSDDTNSATASGSLDIGDVDGDDVTVTLGIPAGNFTSNGVPIDFALSDDGQTLTGTAGGETIVTVTINDAGEFDVVLSGPVDHPDSSVEDELSLEVPVTVSDGTASDTGTITIDIEDDSPVVTGAVAGEGMLLDETDAGAPSGFPISATSIGAVISATTAFGGDGAGSIAYTLGLQGGVVELDSGLATAIGDHPITLVQVDADTIEGRYEDGGTQVAFTIDIDPETGELTVTQEVPLEHVVDGSSAAAHDDPLDLGALVEATVTVTDADGDSASDSAAIGDAIVFEDDGPSINVTADADAGVVLQTQDPDTIGGASDSDSSTADFSGVFDAVFDGGADGAAGTPDLDYSLGLSEPGVNSGLTQTGAPIFLYLIGGVVVGSTSATQAGVLAGNTVFEVSVDGDGVVTLTQHGQIDHPIGSDPDATDAPFADHIISIADDLITLTASGTVTDNDGDTDTDSATVNIGANLEFGDDGPDISVELGTRAQIRIDETDGETAGGEVDPVGGNLGTVTVAGATLFDVTNVHTSADSPTTLSYALTLSSQGVASGLLQSADNAPIFLYNIGGVVYGSTATDAGDVDLGSNVAFTVSIDAESGDVTVTQYLAVEHSDTSSNDELSSALDADVLNVTVTATDFDGDTDSDSVDLGSVIRFEDDGPSATQTQLTGTVDEDGVVEGADDGGTGDGIAGGIGDVAGENTVVNGNVAALFASGSDQPLTFGLSGDTSGLPALTSNGVAVTYAVVGNTLTASAGGETVFTFTLNADGSYTFTLVDQIDHPAGGNENNLSIALGSVIEATDADGDSIIANANGLVITVDDDTPTASSSQITGTVDEDGVIEGADDGGTGDGIAGGTGDVAGEVTVANGSVVSLFNSGADAPLTFSLLADTSGLPALTSNGVAVTYAVVGNTLTASAGGETVFTFTLDADGSYTFTLVDQIDHAPGGNENDLSIALGSIVQATDADGDSVTANANGLVITVDDDTPTATQNQVTGTVDEDGVVEGADDGGTGDGIAGGTGDIAGEATVANGSVATLFNSGADAPLTFSLLADTSGLPALTSNGVAVTYAVVGNTLTASAGGETVFTFTVNADGSYTFTLVDQLDHAPGGNENDLLIALGSIVQATDADGDSVTANANGLVITVDDDTPTVSTARLTETVDEDGLAGGNPGGTGDVPGVVTTASGSVTSVFNSGADAPLTYSLSTNTAGLPALTSNGVAVTYSVSFAAGVYTLTASAGANTVFTLTLDASTGEYDFTLLDQLDHAPGGNENDLAIQLGSILQATDADGDTVTAGGNALVITVDDDTPIASQNQVTGTVDEDGVVEGVANGGIGDGIAGGPGDVPGEATVATGSVTTLFSGGADQPLSYSLSADTTGLPALTSNGVAVTYAVVGNTLTASAGGETVFTFTLNANGSWTFTLVDQIDHPTLNGMTGDNTENNLAIALGSIVQATDADGDTVTANPNGLVITVDDDTPVARNDADAIVSGGTSTTGNVITGAGTTSGAAGADSTGADAPATITAVSGTGGSDTTFTGGVLSVDGDHGTLEIDANGNYTYTRDMGSPGNAQDVFTYTYTDADGDSVTATLTITISDDAPVLTAPPTAQLDDDDVTGADGNPGGTGDDDPANTSGNLDASGGDGDVDFFFSGTQPALPAGFTHNLVDASTMQILQNGTVVLTITLNNETGAYDVVQNNPIDHPAGNNENNLTFNVALFAEDADGDDSNTVNLTINVDDDTPIATATQLTGTVDEDGVVEGADDGGEGDGIAGGVGDVAGEDVTADGNVAALFSPGADQPLTYSLTNNFAALTAQNLTSGGVALSYSVSLVAGVYTLTATAGPGGETVFTLTLDATTGDYEFTLVDQLDHAPGANENDLTINLSSIIQATDADGDSVGAGANGLRITVDDDTPTATTAQLTGTVDEDGVPSGIAGGTGDVPGEVTTAMGDVTALFNSGADEPLSYSLSTDTAGLPALTSGGVPVTYAVTFAAGVYTLTASAGANTVFTLTLDASTGAYEFTLLDQLDHAPGANENDLLINLSSIIRATDADGDTVSAGSNGLIITVDDDSPVAINPDPITTGVENAPGETATADLDVDGQIEDNVGADQPGIVQFANITNGMDSGFTSGGETIEYFLTNNGQTLEARTGGATGDLVFTVDLNQNPTGTDTYTIEMFGTIDNNSGVTFSDLSGGVAGNPPFKLITEPGAELELLVTPINETSVNSDSDDIAAGSQFIEFNTGIRFDFGDFTYVNQGGTTNDDQFVIEEHSNINGYKFTIDQISNGTVVDIRVSAIDANDDGGAAQNNFSADAGDVVDDITMIKVFDTSGTLVAEFTGTDTTSFSFDVIFNPDGTVSFENLPSDYSIQTYTADGYNRIEVFNEGTAAPDGKFSLSQLSIESSDAGDPVQLLLDLQLTDADGDTVVVDDALDITIAPDTTASATSTSTSSMAVQEPLADKSSLLSSNDNFEQQLKSVNAANSNTVFLGAIAAAGLVGTPAAAHNGFTPYGDIAIGGESSTEALAPLARSISVDLEPATSMLVDKGSVAVQDASVPNAASSQSAAPQGGNSLAGEGGDAPPAAVELPGGTEAPAQAQVHDVAPAAMAVAMPSAEMLEAAASGAVDGQQAQTGDVGRVLADALAGGGDGPAIDSLIDALAPDASGHNAALDAVAANMAAAVPAWDMAAFAGFAIGHHPLSIDAMAMSADAAQPVA